MSLLSNKDKFLKGKSTSLRRKSLCCKVYELKISYNKLNKIQREHLNLLFLESKWFYNYILSSGDVFKFNHKINSVQVLNKDKVIENRELKVIPAQVKQELLKRTQTSIKALSSKKKKKKEVGKLKFKSIVNSIPLKQFGITYNLYFNNNTLKLAGLKDKIKVKGLEQLNIKNLEIANANLVRKPSGYYLKVTTFQNYKESSGSKESIGIDFGIKDDLVLSNGIKFKTKLDISKSIKLNQKFLSRKIKGSNNYWKQKNKLGKSYEKYNNKKKDATNKIVSYLKNNYSHIGIQNENIKGWHAGLFGRQVQQSILGGIISKLKLSSHTSIIDRFFPSTKLCPICGILNKLTLGDRTYICTCGYTQDRDIHAANNILLESNKKLVPTECRDFKPVEFNTSALEKLKLSLSRSFVSIDYEAGRYNSRLC